jgi:RND family efflux transporter MFP subunit
MNLRIKNHPWWTIALALLVGGCDRAEPNQTERGAPRVTVAHPVTRPLVDEDEYTGWLRPYQEVEVRSRVRGHIQKVHFHDGDLVKQGQLLFELDPRPFQAAVDQAKAQARVSDAQRVAAEKDVARQRELLVHKAVALSEVEKAEADALSYAARVSAVLQEVEQRKLDLEYARITAPIAGRIGRAMLTEGNLVNAGGSDPLLATIVAVDPVYVEFNVDERAMQRYQAISLGRQDNDPSKPLREKQLTFSFGLDTEKGFPHEGHLVFADNKYTPGTGTILVRGVAKNADGRLIPGSRVRVRVPVSDEYTPTLVPDTAVNTDQNQKYLILVGERNVATRQNVVLGRLLDDGMRVILEPKLKPDTWVIVEGMERARLTYPVEPVPETPSAAATAAK